MASQKTPSPMEFISIMGEARLGPKRSIVSQTREHQIIMDVRKARGGDDSGPTPLECLALSLAGCILNLSRLLAEERGMATGKLSVAVTGSIDPSKAFGLESRNRAGFLELSATIDGVEDWPPSERSLFLQALKERCPICDNLANPTEIRFRFGREIEPPVSREV